MLSTKETSIVYFQITINELFKTDSGWNPLRTSLPDTVKSSRRIRHRLRKRQTSGSVNVYKHSLIVVRLKWAPSL